jgi:hypothetical protein
MRNEGRARAEPDGTRAETTFRLSPKRTSPFKSAGESVQSTAGSRGVRISVSNAGYTTFRGRVRVLATHTIRQFPLHFPSRASPCAITFRTQYTAVWILTAECTRRTVVLQSFKQTRLQVVHSVTWCTDFTKAFLTFKMSYTLRYRCTYNFKYSSRKVRGFLRLF